MFIFFDWVIFARTIGFYNAVFPTARLRALTAVSIACTCHVVRQKATSRIRNTHGTMYEGFDFDVHMFLHLFKICYRYFASRYNARCAKLFPHLHSMPVRRGCLCTYMKFKAWCYPFSQAKDTHVGHDNRINTDTFKKFQIVLKAFKVLIMRNNITCNVDFLTMFMYELNGFLQFFIGKIGVTRTQTKSFACTINGIRTIANSHF